MLLNTVVSRTLIHTMGTVNILKSHDCTNRDFVKDHSPICHTEIKVQCMHICKQIAVTLLSLA